MKIIFIGDIMADAGIKAVKKELPALIEKYSIDYCIANGENVSNAKSMNKEHYQILMKFGIDFFTMGNHTFDQGKLFEYLDDVENIIIPANYNYTLNYPGTKIVKINGKRVRITNFLGQVKMSPIPNCPWKIMDEIVKIDDSDIHIVDFHGECNIEKLAFYNKYKDFVSFATGTHTHVQTADESILDGKIAFISDAGMTGPYDSVNGVDLTCGIKNIKTKIPGPSTPADGKYQFNAVIVEFDDETNNPVYIERINIVERKKV